MRNKKLAGRLSKSWPLLGYPTYEGRIVIGTARNHNVEGLPYRASTHSCYARI